LRISLLKIDVSERIILGKRRSEVEGRDLYLFVQSRLWALAHHCLNLWRGAGKGLARIACGIKELNILTAQGVRGLIFLQKKAIGNQTVILKDFFM